MTITAHIPRRLAAALLATAPLVLLAPVAQAATDGSLLTKASRQATQPLKTGHPTAQVRPSAQAASSPVATGWSAAGARPTTIDSPVATGWSTAGARPTTIDSPVATGWSSAGGPRNAVSELAAGRSPAAAPSAGDGFDWGDAAAGFGVAAFGAAVLAGTAFAVRRRGALIRLP